VGDIKDERTIDERDSIGLYEVKTGNEVFASKAHKRDVSSIAITRNGQTMASASWGEGVVKLWDLDP
jgi:WD40 repeat protein